MKTIYYKIIILLLAIPTAAAAQKNPGAKEIADEFKRFVTSKDMKLLYDHNGKGLFIHYFKYTCKGNEIADSTFVPPAIRRLEKAFDRNIAHSEATFFHRPGDWQWPIREMRVSWPDDYWDRVRFFFPLLDSRNYRFATFGRPDSVRSCYGLVWHAVAFNDKDGKPFRCFDGYILELTGNHWRMDPAGQPAQASRENTHMMQDMYLTQQDTTAYITLKEQIKKLRQLYTESHSANDEVGMDAMAYTLYNIGRDYGNCYTAGQFGAIGSELDSMLAITPEKSGRRMIMMKARKDLADKATADSQIKTVVGSNVRFLQKSFEWKVTNESYTVNDSTLGPVIDWKITGKARPDELEFTITYTSLPRSSRALTAASDGSFAWPCRLRMNQFVRIGNDDATGWTVIADGIPLEIDMESGEMKSGSETNRRLIAYQKRIKRWLSEVRKYSIEVDNYRTRIDPEGFDAVVDSVREIQAEAMHDNPDNMIPALFLSQCYTNMTYGQLCRLMQRDRPYAGHVMMQPVWDYFEGLKKRQPGMMYTDVELQDTAGVSHRLSEYVGKGYVVLHFWNTANGCGRSDIPTLKKINRMHGRDSIKVIGISLNSNRQDWCTYVRNRGIHYTQLSDLKVWDSEAAKAYGLKTLPAMIVIAPDGRIVAEDLRGDALLEKMESLTGAR